MLKRSGCIARPVRSLLPHGVSPGMPLSVPMPKDISLASA